MVEHRNVMNFFTGMDGVIAHDPPGVWLAVTSLSFDISVLELFWTLARGFKVVIYRDRTRAGEDLSEDVPAEVSARGMQFGLFLWGADDTPGPDKYRLMLEGARFFDEHGFDSVWTPERHFHAFGGAFPNPSVTGAALAAVTKNLSIRAGSCVSPLHHPIRIAEEWAVVDDLSGGRVGVSFAAGWQPNDFVLRPENHADNKAVMIEQIETVRRLWRGERVSFPNPMGDQVDTLTLPRPVQEELPVWITAAGNPDTYRLAGELGGNLLTHLLGQSVDELAEKIAIYRQARSDAGFDPTTGTVSLMLHTLVGTDDDAVREIVREPMKEYLRAALKLTLGFAWTFSAFKRPGGPGATPEDIDLSSLSEDEVDAILEFAFERYCETSGLFGTPVTCLKMINRCKAAGVDEVACLMDFGADLETVFESMPNLKLLRDRANKQAADATPSDLDQSIGAQIERLKTQPGARGALRSVEHLMIGGEAFPPDLARELDGITGGTITNMYGPTETTIWSSTQVINGAAEPIAIGRPIANTVMYVLDEYQQPVPPGVPGDLYIGGAGVVRGYHARSELTNQRFLPDPFHQGRMYWTGDLARFRSDGVIDFLGRVDYQAKLHGYRIELGEIESRISELESVKECVVVIREREPDDKRLVAYIVPSGEANG